jgi:nitroreductase
MKSTILDVINNRKTTREFRSDMPPEEDLMSILDAACRPPFGGHEEPFRIILLRNRAKIQEMADRLKEYVRTHDPGDCPMEEAIFFATYFESAPAVFLCAWHPTCVIPDFRRKMETDSGVRDLANAIGLLTLGSAIENLLLSVQACGLAAGYLGPFLDQAGLEGIIGLEKPFRVAVIIPVGYPLHSEPKKPRSTDSLKIVI